MRESRKIIKMVATVYLLHCSRIKGTLMEVALIIHKYTMCSYALMVP